MNYKSLSLRNKVALPVILMTGNEKITNILICKGKSESKNRKWGIINVHSPLS